MTSAFPKKGEVSPRSRLPWEISAYSKNAKARSILSLDKDEPEGRRENPEKRRAGSSRKSQRFHTSTSLVRIRDKLNYVGVYAPDIGSKHRRSVHGKEKLGKHDKDYQKDFKKKRYVVEGKVQYSDFAYSQIKSSKSDSLQTIPLLELVNDPQPVAPLRQLEFDPRPTFRTEPITQESDSKFVRDTLREIRKWLLHNETKLSWDEQKTLASFCRKTDETEEQSYVGNLLDCAINMSRWGAKYRIAKFGPFQADLSVAGRMNIYHAVKSLESLNIGMRNELLETVTRFGIEDQGGLASRASRRSGKSAMVDSDRLDAVEMSNPDREGAIESKSIESIASRVKDWQELCMRHKISESSRGSVVEPVTEPRDDSTLEPIPEQTKPGSDRNNQSAELEIDEGDAFGKLNACLIYLVCSALAHNQNTAMVEGLGTTKEKSPGGTQEGSANNASTSNLSSISNLSNSNSVTRDNGQSSERKHGRRNDEDEDGLGPPRKKQRFRCSLDIEGNLACPFAKGDPERFEDCLMINRKDLPGIREHLKRKHFREAGGVPSEITRAKTWTRIFHVCNPDWPTNVPVPQPHFDIQEMYSFRYKRARNASSRVSSMPLEPLMHETSHTRISPASGSSDTESTTEAYYSNNPNQTPNYETTPNIPSNENTPPSDMNMEAPTAFPMVPSSIQPEATFDELMQDWLLWADESLITTENSLKRLDSSSYCFPSGYCSASVVSKQPGSHSGTAVALDDPSSDSTMEDQTSLTSEIPAEESHQEQSVSDLITTESTPVRVQDENKKKYLLRIARNPALPKRLSTESSRHKQFFFEDMDEFDSKFEPWMKANFSDPVFCWENWQIENPLRKGKLPNREELVEELEFVWDAYRSERAAFYLVPKHVEGMA